MDFTNLTKHDPEVMNIIEMELNRQKSILNL